MPLARISSTMYWMVGLSTMGSISFGMAFVAGRNRVPNPAAGMTAFLMCFIVTPFPGMPGLSLLSIYRISCAEAMNFRFIVNQMYRQ